MIHNYRVYLKLNRIIGKQIRFLHAQKDGNEGVSFGLKSQFASLVIGIGAGATGSLVGMGGAFIALPLLKGALKLHPHTAHGTSIATVLLTSIGACFAYSQKSNIDQQETVIKLKENETFPYLPATIANINLPVALFVAGPASLTAIIGARMSKGISAKPLNIAMGIFMLTMAPMLHINEMVKMEKTKKVEQLQLDESGTLDLMTAAKVIISINPFSPSLRTNQYCAMIGATSGILSGVFGVGGGAIMVPALCLFTDMDYRMVIGTSLFCMLPVAISASITHYLQGSMLLTCAVPLGIGSFIGSYIGGSLTQYCDDSYLRSGYSIFMLMIGSQTLFLALKSVR